MRYRAPHISGTPAVEPWRSSEGHTAIGIPARSSLEEAPWSSLGIYEEVHWRTPTDSARCRTSDKARSVGAALVLISFHRLLAHGINPTDCGKCGSYVECARRTRIVCNGYGLATESRNWYSVALFTLVRTRQIANLHEQFEHRRFKSCIRGTYQVFF